jgi:hypothetical protein
MGLEVGLTMEGRPGMPETRTLCDISIAVELGDLLRVSKSQSDRPAFRAAAAWALERMLALARPRAAYRWLATAGIEDDRLLLQGEASLAIGEKVELFLPACEVLVAVSTIGPEVEEEVRTQFGGGASLEGYLLDCAGVLALGCVGDRIRALAEEEAARRGWGVSLRAAPGSLVGWPVRGQRELCALLDLASIGVTLNSSSILHPAKSGSSLIGIGPEYTARRVGSPCRFCNLRATCWRRRDDDHTC